VIKIDPQNYVECSVAQDSEKFNWQFQFLVKDATTQVNKNLYKVIVYSGIKDYCLDFFGKDVKPCDLSKDEATFERVKKHFENLLGFNVWCDALLTKIGEYFVMKDTQLFEAPEL
jgi:hypothetical protein